MNSLSRKGIIILLFSMFAIQCVHAQLSDLESGYESSKAEIID